MYGFRDRESAEGIIFDGNILLALDIPKRDALSSQHAPWCTEVLAGARVAPRITPDELAVPTTATDEDTWQTIFDTNGYTSTIQVVFDRIEPSWLIEPDLQSFDR